MSGRGRGRGGSGISLTLEQQQALGIARGENSAPILGPPPLYPKNEAKPLPLACDAATDYMLIVKDQFIEFLHESPAYVTFKSKTDNVERYSDKYKMLALDAKKGSALDCVWTNMPSELRLLAQSRPRVNRKRKLDDPKEIAKRLQNLEKKETNEDQEGQQIKQEEDTNKKVDSDDENVEEEQEYEQDDGTDYGNNYFDNGEEYDEEDDNLDDGPVY